MKSIIITCVAAGLLFALSAALSLYLTSTGKPEADPATGKQDSARKADKKGKKPDGEERVEGKKDTPHTAGHGDPPSPKPTDDPAGLLKRLNQRASDLQRREEEVQRQEQRLQLVMDDIQVERSVMDSIRARLSEELKRLDDKRGKIELDTRNLDEQKRAVQGLLAQLEKDKTAFGRDEAKNIGRMATISDSMPADKAARILEQLANSGQIDTAVKLLFEMKERRAAAVLAEVTDVVLAARLLDRLRGLKRPPAPAPGT